MSFKFQLITPSFTDLFVGCHTSASAQVLRKLVVTPIQHAHAAATPATDITISSLLTLTCCLLSTIEAFIEAFHVLYLLVVAELLASCLCQSAENPPTTIFPCCWSQQHERLGRRLART